MSLSCSPQTAANDAGRVKGFLALGQWSHVWNKLSFQFDVLVSYKTDCRGKQYVSHTVNTKAKSNLPNQF